MKTLCLLTIGLALAGSALAGDWRADLLKEEGIGLAPAELKKAISGVRFDVSEFEAAYDGLGSDEYPERVRSHRRFLSAGPQALEWLRKQPKSSNPEVRNRISKILDALTFPDQGGRERMIRHAVSTLLDEAGGKMSPATGGTFFEWFGSPAKKLAGDYRSFSFETEEGMGGEVVEGRVILEGKRNGDGDQRLVLKSDKWPGQRAFPNEFVVSANMMGTEGGAGGWHLGISIGRVRVLFHPGYNGGGFRFEEVGTAKYLGTNSSMGFTPSHKDWQRMRVKVRKMKDGSTELAVLVEQKGNPRFEASIKVAGDVIGKIDQVSLDRSGRTGGDAMFDDFLIEFDE